MTKSPTEQFLYGQLMDGYWFINKDGHEEILEVEKGKYYIGDTLVCRAFMGDIIDKIEVLAPVPSYEKWKTQEDLLLIYKKENKRLKAVAEHCEKVAGQWSDKLVDTERKVERLENQNADLSKKVHILNEAGEKKYNELCEEIKKNNRLEKQLAIATKALKEFKALEDNYLDYHIDNDGNKIDLHPNRVATNALKEIEEVK